MMLRIAVMTLGVLAVLSWAAPLPDSPDDTGGDAAVPDDDDVPAPPIMLSTSDGKVLSSQANTIAPIPPEPEAVKAAEAALATSSKAAAQMTTQPNGDKPPQVPAGSVQKSTEAQQKPTETAQKPAETAQKPAETTQKAAESTSKATTIVVDAKVWGEALNASALIEKNVEERKQELAGQQQQQSTASSSNATTSTVAAVKPVEANVAAPAVASTKNATEPPKKDEETKSEVKEEVLTPEKEIATIVAAVETAAPPAVATTTAAAKSDDAKNPDENDSAEKAEEAAQQEEQEKEAEEADPNAAPEFEDRNEAGEGAKGEADPDANVDVVKAEPPAEKVEEGDGIAKEDTELGKDNNNNIHKEIEDAKGNHGQENLPPPAAVIDFEQSEDSHFMTFVLVGGTLVFVIYLLQHNKKKILGMMFEGRSSNTGRGRYRRLSQKDDVEVVY